MKTIYFAGGCFWGVEKFFSLVNGVASTLVGYANGKTNSTAYEQLKDSGHAEAVQIKYDESRVSLTFLLNLFYQIIDPTLLNRQAGDVGTQYRTGIYYIEESDKEIIEGSLILLQESLKEKVVVEALPLSNFCVAEQYHQEYLNKNPNGYCHIDFFAFEKAKNAVDTRTLSANTSLRQWLTPLQFEVTQSGATESPFENEYYNNFKQGIYVDITSGEPLFLSSDKFDSGCGWPSFCKPISQELVCKTPDTSFNRNRTEIASASSRAHLGHIFNDAPKELGGMRYCVNSASLRFIPLDEMEEKGYKDLIPLVEKGS